MAKKPTTSPPKDMRQDPPKIEPGFITPASPLGRQLTASFVQTLLATPAVSSRIERGVCTQADADSMVEFCEYLALRILNGPQKGQVRP